MLVIPACVKVRKVATTLDGAMDLARSARSLRYTKLRYLADSRQKRSTGIRSCTYLVAQAKLKNIMRLEADRNVNKIEDTGATMVQV